MVVGMTSERSAETEERNEEVAKRRSREVFKSGEKRRKDEGSRGWCDALYSLRRGITHREWEIGQCHIMDVHVEPFQSQTYWKTEEETKKHAPMMIGTKRGRSV
jgi:hypothetical protein